MMGRRGASGREHQLRFELEMHPDGAPAYAAKATGAATEAVPPRRRPAARPNRAGRPSRRTGHARTMRAGGGRMFEGVITSPAIDAAGWAVVQRA